MAKRKTKDAVDSIHKRFDKGEAKRLAGLDEARASGDVARQIYTLRTEAGLTQAQLAKLVRTSRSVISRLEDDDYGGHSLAMLRRIAAAMDRRVEIRFVLA